jgi:hypothetical protein
MAAPACGRPVSLHLAGIGGNKAFRPPKNLNILSVLWASSVTHAVFVIDATRARLDAAGKAATGADGFDISEAEMRESLFAAAAEIGASLESNETVERNAEQAIAEIEKTFQQMQRDGGLKLINKSYREYRATRLAAGERAQLYSGWITNYKLRIIRAAAKTSRTLGKVSFGTICPL